MWRKKKKVEDLNFSPKVRAILESPTFQKAINERFGGVINQRNVRLLLNDPKYMEAVLKEQQAEYDALVAKAESAWEEEKERRRKDEDLELLQRTEEAVRAKREAEANPNDPLSWLRMAKAMDAANRHEEAERCRKTAMELMEKKTL